MIVGVGGGIFGVWVSVSQDLFPREGGRLSCGSASACVWPSGWRVIKALAAVFVGVGNCECMAFLALFKRGASSAVIVVMMLASVWDLKGGG